MHDLITIRPALVEDLHFILNSWLKSYQKYAAQPRGDIYFVEHQRVIERLLARSTIAVVTTKKDPDIICGYAVYEESKIPILHYVYVKLPYRRMKFASLLMDHLIVTEPIIVSHKTPLLDAFLKGKKWLFNPWRIYEY